MEHKVKLLERQLELKERENIQLKSEGDRKATIFSKAKQQVKYLALQELHHDHGWSIQWMCKVHKIVRSSYYKWMHRIETNNELKNYDLCNLILDYYEMFGRILVPYSIYMI